MWDLLKKHSWTLSMGVVLIVIIIIIIVTSVTGQQLEILLSLNSPKGLLVVAKPVLATILDDSRLTQGLKEVIRLRDASKFRRKNADMARIEKELSDYVNMKKIELSEAAIVIVDLGNVGRKSAGKQSPWFARDFVEKLLDRGKLSSSTTYIFGDEFGVEKPLLEKAIVEDPNIRRFLRKGFRRFTKVWDRLTRNEGDDGDEGTEVRG